MLDGYPHIFPIENAPRVHDVHRRHLSRVAQAVSRRTGLRACFNARSSTVLFYRGEPDGGPLALPAFRADGSDRRYESHEIDDAVLFIGHCRQSRKDKDRIARNNDQIEGWRKSDAIAARIDERRPTAIDYAGFLDQKRRGTRKFIGV